MTYFRSTGGIESVLAGKELATERAMRDIAQDIIQRVIYQKYSGRQIDAAGKDEETE